MIEIKVEKGVPIPTARGKYPWKGMEVGDSFVIVNCTNSVKRGLHSCASRYGYRICTRREGAGFRVWRVS